MNQIDRLAQIRAAQRALSDEEREIRIAVLAGETSMIGDDYVAVVRHHVLLRRITERD